MSCAWSHSGEVTNWTSEAARMQLELRWPPGRAFGRWVSRLRHYIRSAGAYASMRDALTSVIKSLHLTPPPNLPSWSSRVKTQVSALPQGSSSVFSTTQICERGSLILISLIPMRLVGLAND